MSQNTHFFAIFWYKIFICAIVYAFSAMFKTYNFACSQVVTISPLISELFLQYKSPMSTVHMWAVGEVWAKKSSFRRQVCKGILSARRVANVKEDPQRKLSRNCKNINLAVGISKPAFYTSWRRRTNSILCKTNRTGRGWQILKCRRAADKLSNGGSGHEARSWKRTQHLLLDLAAVPRSFFFGRCFARFTDNLVLASIKWRQQQEGVDIISQGHNIIQIYYQLLPTSKHLKGRLEGKCSLVTLKMRKNS